MTSFLIRRLFITFLFGIVLAALVYATFALKADRFGQTPFFYSVGVAMKYGLDSLSALFLHFNIDSVEAAQNEKARSLPVLTYHRVVSDENDLNNVTATRFKNQMLALKNAGWETVTLQEFEEFMRGTRELPEKSFLLTFDDGAKESYYPVDPVLRTLGYEAVMFVIVRSSQTPHSTYYLSQQEVRQMLETGRWSIGSHSYDGHRPYETGPDHSEGVYFADKLWIRDAQRIETDQEFKNRVHNDLARAQSILESTYDVPIVSFAFPLGNETGVAGANNYPEGASVTETEADAIYEFGHLQTNNQTFTFNFPATTPYLATNFIVRRIHVDYDWDGARLLSVMENGLPKSLPFEDDFSQDHGWIPAWGDIDIGRNNLTLQATPELSSASLFLDGTALWDNYTFDASINWTQGFVYALADVIDSKTYDACAFSPGSVRIQRTVNGETTTLKETKDPRITYGNVQIGIRVHDTVIECTWDFESIAEEYSREHGGGIGLQAWNEQLGTAGMQVSSIIARPYQERQ